MASFGQGMACPLITIPENRVPLRFSKSSARSDVRTSLVMRDLHAWVVPGARIELATLVL